MVDPDRVRVVADAPVRADRAYVLYWMTAARRTRFNPALEHAVAWAERLGRPLLVFEGLRSRYAFACERFHAFVRDGMVDNFRSFAEVGVSYVPWMEGEPEEGRAVFARLAAEACVVVADDAPLSFLPRMLAAAAARVDVRMEAVDGWGLLPVRAAPGAFGRAMDFRRFLQKELAVHLDRWPQVDPLALYDLGPARSPVERRLPAELGVEKIPGRTPFRGGESNGRAALGAFAGRLDRWNNERAHPDANAGAHLSPWLHWGQLSTFEVVEALAPGARPVAVGGRREGGWGGVPAELFLDELVTWRELCANTACFVEGYDRYASLPAWARATLEAHAGDARTLHELRTLDEARTEDPIWNACQRQLRAEGRIPNQLRMLWGKKLLGWSPSPAEAWERLAWLNNRWSLDGRDPNSWGGIAWVFGRYDHPWPERPVFGTVRAMTSASAARKLRLGAWLERWSADS